MFADLQRQKAISENPEAEKHKYGQNNGMTLAMLRGKEYDDEDWDKLLDQMTFEDQSFLLTNGMYTTVYLESVVKPDTKDYDGPTGVVGSKGGLSMPSEGIWASSFNNELIEKVGEMLAEDARALGYSSLYANAINIHRMPFGGRSHEYFSEDPYLTAIAAVYEIRGILSKGVIANVKHIAFNDQEDHRAGGSVWLNEQEAREIMLLPFEYALSSKEGMGNAHAVMSAMNRIGTDWVGANTNLLVNIMRGEWDFDGYCTTDMAASNTAYIMNFQDGIARGTDIYLGSGEHIGLGSRVTVGNGERITLYAEWLKRLDGDDLLFSEIAPNTLSLTGYRGRGDVNPFVIPSEIEGKQVIEIASSFTTNMPSGRLTADTLVLPNTIKKVAGNSFLHSAFSEIYFSDNIEEVSEKAFPYNFKTYHINAVLPPCFQAVNNSVLLADNMDRLILNAENKKLIFFSGCSTAYGLVSPAMDFMFGKEYTVFNMGMNGDINGAFQLKIIINYLGERNKKAYGIL